jgi:hypothetical protein
MGMTKVRGIALADLGESEHKEDGSPTGVGSRF